LHTILYVEEAKPRMAFYENVYRKPLAELLRRHGWHVERFDMSRLVPQRRVRLIARKARSTPLLGVSGREEV
jgi:hypothetical protein